MLKPNRPSEGEAKDESAAPDDQGPSLADLMMLVFSGPLRQVEDADESEGEETEEKSETS